VGNQPLSCRAAVNYRALSSVWVFVVIFLISKDHELCSCDTAVTTIQALCDLYESWHMLCRFPTVIICAGYVWDW